MLNGVELKFNHQPGTVTSAINEEDHSKIEELAQKDFEEKKAKWQNKERTN